MATEYDNVESELDAMINGSYEVEETEDKTNDEDTDRNGETEDVTETNDEAAESNQDTDESEVDTGEENTPVDDDSSEESGEEVDGEGESKDESEVEAEVEADDAGDDKDSTEPEVEADGADTETTDDIDYKKQYEELLTKSKKATDFYDKVAGVEIKANGQMTTSFTDPDKILQSQQMMYNYSDKMAGFKQYRPFMSPLKDRGMLDDPAKFDLAMSLVDGNQDALKQHIKNLNIDPMELDMDEINYAAEAQTSSRELIEIEDALDVASNYGVKDRVFDTVMKQWDDSSYAEFAKNPDIQHDLAQQMENGVYDKVMSRVKQTAVLDQRFAGMRQLDQYNTIAAQMNKEFSQQSSHSNEAALAEAKRVEAETKKQEQYKKDVAKKNAEAKAARDKAAKASKDKSVTQKKKAEDPMAMSGADMSKLLDQMIMGKK